MKNSKIQILVAVSLMAMFAGCKSEKKRPPRKAPVVTVTKPVVKEILNYFYASSNVRACEKVDVVARVTGTLEKIYFKPSQYVKKGDPLFLIEQTQYKAAVDSAEAEVSMALVGQELAVATLKRKEAAYKKKAVSELDFIESKSAVAQAKATLKAAQAKLEDAKRTYGYTKILSPIDGQVSRSFIDVGNVVSVDSTPLTTVVDSTPCYAYFTISQSELEKVMGTYGSLNKFVAHKPKSELSVDLEKGYTNFGFIDYVDNHINSSTATIRMRSNFPNKKGLLVDGAFARLRFPSERIKDALLVPEVAIGTSQRGKYVMVVNDKNIVEIKPVEVGSVEDQMIHVVSGLSKNDRVIVKGLLSVRPGSPADPRTENEQEKKPTAEQSVTKPETTKK
jgi:multidrug efflux system membrane fusion protein